jgi:hypothetical protein
MHDTARCSESSNRPMNHEMIDRQRLRAQLSVHEDRRHFVYDDCTGKPIGEGTFVRGLPTVGVGRNLADSRTLRR